MSSASLKSGSSRHNSSGHLNEDVQTTSPQSLIPSQHAPLVEYLKNYHIDFGTIMDMQESRVLFEAYLNKTMNQEAILFIKAVESFRSLRSAENRHREAVKIVQDFIQSGAKMQVNISEELRKATLSQFERSTATFCGSSLFDPCFDLICMQLQQCTFQRFLETPEFIEFVREQLRAKGRKALLEFGKPTNKKQKSGRKTPKTPSSPSTPIKASSLNSFAPKGTDSGVEESDDDSLSINTAELLGDAAAQEEAAQGKQSKPQSNATTSTSDEMEEDKKNFLDTKFLYYQKKENPLIDATPLREELEFLQFMAKEDSDLLKVLYKPFKIADKFQSYICKKPFKMGKKQGVLIRLQFDLPFDYEAVAQVYFTKKFRVMSDPNIYSINKLETIPANADKQTFAHFITAEKYKIGFPFSHRYFILSNCLVKDTQKEQIIDLRKSCHFIDPKTGQPMELDGKYAITWLYGGTVLSKIDATHCRVTEAFAINLNSPLSSEMVAKIGAARIEKAYKVTLALLKNEFQIDVKKQQDDELQISKIISENESIFNH